MWIPVLHLLNLLHFGVMKLHDNHMMSYEPYCDLPGVSLLTAEHHCSSFVATVK